MLHLTFTKTFMLGFFHKNAGSHFSVGLRRGMFLKAGSLRNPETSRSDYFKPSFTQVKRDTATKLWNKIVIKGMKIEKYMYAMKHTGADDKILAGISLDALRDMYGHTSKLMTEKYARKVKDIYREQIVMNSPSF